MPVMDAIGDMLTRVRNSISARHLTVTVSYSQVKQEIINLLKKYRYIKNFVVVEENNRKLIKILLKYKDNKNAIQGIQRVSTPGLRMYSSWDRIPKVRNGLGIAVVSSSKGVLTDRECRRLHIGGEVLCKVW